MYSLSEFSVFVFLSLLYFVIQFRLRKPSKPTPPERQDKEMSTESTLPRLTLEEKVSLLSGSNFCAATGIPRLGLPAVKLLDSVNGVKGSSHINGVPTLCFPNTACLASTWNRSLMQEMGRELAIQARYKGVSVLLGPAINIHRDPRGGRNFEYWSEDPLLTGKLAAELVNGIQEGGVAACPKHFIGNESESKRRFYDLKESPNERTIREIYLAAFQHLLRDCSPMAIMSAYNKIDSTWCSESPIIRDVLRQEWGFRGVVMSDWFGTRSGIPALKAGLDLEMPGPSAFRGKQLIQAVRDGRIDERVVDESSSRMLNLINRVSSIYSDEEKSVVNEKANSLARRVASEGIVLLKNKENVLPLSFSNSPSIAIVGPFAEKPPINGGGSASAPPQHHASPIESIRASHPTSSRIQYEPGMKFYTDLPTLPLPQTRSSNGKPGIDISYYVYNNPNPVLTETIPSAQTAMIGFLKPPLTPSTFSHFTLSTTLAPLTTGNHTIGIQPTSSFTLTLNNIPILSDAMNPPPTVEDFLFCPRTYERSVTVPMTAGTPYTLTATINPYVPGPDHSSGEPSPHAAKLCYLEEFSASSLLSSALSIASTSDITLIFAGRDGSMESEGFDLTSLKLPEDQETLIKSVASCSKKSVLVLYAGNPVDISAYEHLIDAIVLAHFPGQEGAEAVVDILTGRTCPSGKLATSWPMKLEDVSSYAHFPARKEEDGNCVIRYKEGLRVGYRNEDMKPRYPFGHGLSYTSFQHSSLSCCISGRGAERKLTISVDVENVGVVAGQEVIQVYIQDVEASVWRPREELKAFEKVYLQPGEKQTVRMSVGLGVALSYWDERAQCWTAEQGEFRIRVADLCERVRLQKGFTWRGL